MRFLSTVAAPAFAAAFATAVASPADAGASLLHTGMNDPTTEGFGRGLAGTDPGPSPGNDGLDYWEIDTTDPATTFLFYNVPEFDGTLIAILAQPNGWVLTATARVLESTGATRR